MKLGSKRAIFDFLRLIVALSYTFLCGFWKIDIFTFPGIMWGLSKNGPDRFFRFDVYQLQTTDKQTINFDTEGPRVLWLNFFSDILLFMNLKTYFLFV